MMENRRHTMHPAKAISVGATALLLGLGSCHSIDPYLDRCREVKPTGYVVVAPASRFELPCVKSLLERRSASGLRLSRIRFDADAPVEERWKHVNAALQAVRPKDGETAYVLFLASGEELPCGPWKIEGLDDPIESDIPLLLGRTNQNDAVDQAAWSSAFDGTFPWIPGRIPLTDPAALGAVLSPAGDVRRPSDESPLALLGAERFAVWWDTSIIMSRARVPLEHAGFRTITYAEDWPCDLELGRTDPEDLRAQHELVGLDRGPADAGLVFASHWAHLAPDVVYLNSHGSSFFTTSVGDYLLSIAKLDRLAKESKALGCAARPRRPAIAVIAACRAGGPSSDLMQRLLSEGWAHTVIASAENTSPTPLWVAIWAEIDTSAALASGLSTGLAMRAVLESYYADAADSWSWLLFGSTAPAVARNLLALSLYGDPAREAFAPANAGD